MEVLFTVLIATRFRLLFHYCVFDGYRGVAAFTQWRRNEFESGGGWHRFRAEVGAPIQREVPEKNFLVVPLYFLALKTQLVVLVGAFVIASTFWSVYCLRLFYIRSPQ